MNHNTPENLRRDGLGNSDGRHGSWFIMLALIVVNALLAAGQTAITTYHYDNNRTGWNKNETVLTPANVNQSSFGLLQTVILDDQVDAQPLVMPSVQITAGNHQGTHDVVYVATEGNTVYAIDVHTGTILLNPNFGTPVSSPLGCNNNGPNVGITSTPVIDPNSNTLYVMIYTQDPSGPAYRLRALDLGSLTDKVTPQVVTASHALTDGTTFTFNAKYQRQRPALVLANGSIYAGFGSFCDLAPNLTRGWLLGWTAGSLTPFPSNQILDQQATSPNTFFLSSIWMSGYGPSVDDAGSILFVTGNSDPSGTTYDGVTNIQESVVKVSPTLSTVVDLFTPFYQASLDKIDNDFGSGGVMVLPDQPGSTPHMATAMGKYGELFLMNEDNLGGYSPTQNSVLARYFLPACWCGESYFVDPVDGLGRVVTSAGTTLEVWKLQTSPKASLTSVSSASITAGVQDPGFFTWISSNGTATPIIWALSRPTNNNPAPISLYAFNPESGGSTMTQLFKATAGAWPNTGGNANLVPVAANGLVFVASNKQLQIFGLTGTPVATNTTLTSSVNPSVSGTPVVFSATVSPQSGTGVPTGNVTFYNGTTALATLSLSSGSAQYTTSALPVGSNSITAAYGGSATYSGSTSAPVNQVVQKVATNTTLTSSVNPSTSGQPVVFSATVSPQSGAGVPTGNVTFYNGTTALATLSLSSGSAQYTTSALPVGSNSITAAYGGSATYSGSTSAPLNQVVQTGTAHATTTTLSSSLNPSASGQSVVFSATVSPQSGTGVPTGNVTFYNGTTALATVKLASGSAKYRTSQLPPGTSSITAVYGGDTNNNGSTSAPVNQVVTAATTTTVTSSPNPSTYGQSVSFTATVTSSAGSPPNGESVSFMKGTVLLGTGTLSGGSASFKTSTLTVGTYGIKAVYAGDANFSASTKAVTQTIGKATTTTALASSLNPSNFGLSVTFTATVVPEFSGTPTGAVVFKNGTATLGTATLSGGVASYTTTKLPVGEDSITAVYTGNVSFIRSTSTPLTQTVN